MVVNTLRAVRWTFSTSGLTLIYLASAGGVLNALLFGWGFVDGARWSALVTLLVALPYLTALMAVQLLRTNRDAALILLFAASLTSGVAAWMFSFSIFGIVLWAATPALLLGTLLIALSEISLEHRRAGTWLSDDRPAVTLTLSMAEFRSVDGCRRYRCDVTTMVLATRLPE